MKKFHDFDRALKAHTAVMLQTSSSEYLAMQATKWPGDAMPAFEPLSNSSQRIWSSHVFDNQPTTGTAASSCRLKLQLKNICQHCQQAPQASNCSVLQGQVYADRRSNLLGENAEKLLFLTYNTCLISV